VDVVAAVGHGVDLAVASVAHLDRLVAHGVVVRVHLHLDTGPARDGAPPAGWDVLCAALRRAETAGHVRVVGVMGHLRCADGPADAANGAGRAAFLVAACSRNATACAGQCGISPPRPPHCRVRPVTSTWSG